MVGMSDRENGTQLGKSSWTVHEFDVLKRVHVSEGSLREKDVPVVGCFYTLPRHASTSPSGRAPQTAFVDALTGIRVVPITSVDA